MCVCVYVGKADLSDHFDSMQSREAIHLLVLPPLPSGGEVRRLLLDLDPYGGTDPLGMFPVFLKRTADYCPLSLCRVLAACSSW